jgi:hydroxymethylbilane synthase
MSKVLTVGTRGSALALKQTELVRSQLEKHWPDLEVRVVVIKTKGDKIRDVALSRIGDKGLFVKELEEALLERRIDLAVHSMKDVPVSLPPGLGIVCVSERADPRDVLVSAGGETLGQLPCGARLGTCSLRRKAQLRHHRPDLILHDLRGNVPTRLAKMRRLALDGVVLAAAALERLGLSSEITEYLPPSVCLPAVGQGAIGVEAREADEEVARLLHPLHHPPSAAAIAAERAFLAALGGGCQVPVAALGQLGDGRLHLEGMVASLDGKRLVRGSISGSPEEARHLGSALAEELLHLGAESILREIRQ